MPYDPNSGGRLATPIESFHAHIAGTGFNQPASSITTSPGISGAGDLQTSLNNIQTFINNAAENGIGYAAVPNSYNSYRNATSTVFFDNTTLSLDSLLNPIFTAIMTGGTIPVGYERLKFGGVLFIPAGTYYVVNSITVPPGIVILGEGYGTKIVNATRLNLTTSPPTINSLAPQQPVFIAAIDNNRSTNDSAVDPSKFIFGRATRFMNLTICDNFYEPTLLGDFNYLLPQNVASGSTKPLIAQQTGSCLELFNVNLAGRVVFSSGKVVSSSTQFAIRLDPTLGTTSGTILKISHCFIDGFSIPISFHSVGGINDYLEVSNCKIRSHGYLGGDGSTIGNNCIISTNDNNLKVVDNDLFGNHQHCNTIVFIFGTIASAPTLDSISRAVIAGNTFLVDRGDTATITPNIYSINGTITTLNNYVSYITYGNTYNTTTGFSVSVGSGGELLDLFNGKVKLSNTTQLQLGEITSTSGRVLMQNGEAITAANSGASGNINLINSDVSNNINIGDNVQTANVNIESTIAINLNSGSAVHINDSIPLILGITNIPSTGIIRLKNANGIVGIDNVGVNDIAIIKTDSSNNVIVGDNGAVAPASTYVQSGSNIFLSASSAVMTWSSSSVLELPQNASPPVSGTSQALLWSDTSSRLSFIDANSTTMQMGKVVKTITNDLNTTNTVTPVSTNLSFAVGATDVWYFFFDAPQVGSTTVNGVKFAISMPTGATISARGFGQNSSATAFYEIREIDSTSNPSIFSPFINYNGAGSVKISGYIKMDGTHAGTVAFTYNAITSGTVTIYAGATLIAYPTTLV